VQAQKVRRIAAMRRVRRDRWGTLESSDFFNVIIMFGRWIALALSERVTALPWWCL
jgi:hypothetical protein